MLREPKITADPIEQPDLADQRATEEEGKTYVEQMTEIIKEVNEEPILTLSLPEGSQTKGKVADQREEEPK